MKIRLLLLSAALLSYNVSFGRDCDGGLSPEVTETEITATGHEAPPAAPANIEPDAFRISSIRRCLPASTVVLTKKDVGFHRRNCVI